MGHSLLFNLFSGSLLLNVFSMSLLQFQQVGAVIKSIKILDIKQSGVGLNTVLPSLPTILYHGNR